MVDADVLKDLPNFNAKIKVGEVNKIKRREAVMDKINKQLPPNNDTYYIQHNRTTDSFRVRKDNKIKKNDDNDNDIEFFKKLQVIHVIGERVRLEDLNVWETKKRENPKQDQ